MDEKLKQSYRRERFWLNILAWAGGTIFLVVFFWLKYLEATGQRF